MDDAVAVIQALPLMNVSPVGDEHGQQQGVQYYNQIESPRTSVQRRMTNMRTRIRTVPAAPTHYLARQVRVENNMDALTAYENGVLGGEFHGGSYFAP